MGNIRRDRVIVFGIDGLHPGILENLMEAGELPNFASIAKSGAYRRLATTNPPQSPVVWSSIATGSNPGCHGVFDFIARNPKNYLPELAVLKVNEKNLFARRESMFLPTRKGTAFWDLTSRQNIPTTVIRWPMTFPPEEVSGRMLSGLGVPDMKTNLGRHTFYTTRSISEDEKKEGDVISLTFSRKSIKTSISGPRNSRVPLIIVIDEENAGISLDVAGKKYTLKAGEWSNWIRLKFSVGLLRHVSAICRFYLKSVKPLELYLSPIQVDPENPAFPISHPDEYAAELSREIGDYHTLGIPEDTNALNDDCFDAEAFLDSCDRIMAEREKMLWHELERFREGLLAFVFDTTDRIQHIFWRCHDPKHPSYDAEFAREYGNVIADCYKRMDRILGETLRYVDDKTAIIILSDHGFASFRRAVHLNAWLVMNELMVLDQPPEDEEGGSLFKHVAWEKTRAYAVGFSGIYLNYQGREGKGMVTQGAEVSQLKEKISASLSQLKDPKTGKPVIRGVYDRDDLYSGPYAGNAPDLIVGFNPGYRTSWQTAIGGTPERILEDNLKKWTGDHIVDPYYVPGILFMNQKIERENPGVLDIAPTILGYFGIHKSGDMVEYSI